MGQSAFRAFSLVTSKSGSSRGTPTSITVRFTVMCYGKPEGRKGSVRGPAQPNCPLPGELGPRTLSRPAGLQAPGTGLPGSRASGLGPRACANPGARVSAAGCTGTLMSRAGPPPVDCAPRGSRETPRRTTQKTPPQVGRAFPVRAAAACSHPCASRGARAGRAVGHAPTQSQSPRAGREGPP